MTVYKAIAEMRRLTERGEHFSFTFMSYSENRQKSEGIIDVSKARLGTRDKSTVQNSEIMLTYIDLNTGEQRRVYQPLIIMFQGKKLELQ